MSILNPKLFTICCLLSSISLGFIFPKSSQAQSAVFNFQTTIGGECSFSNIQSGSLQLTPDRKEFISNSPASATLDCNATNLIITLNPPEVSPISAPFSIASSTATATYQENNPFSYVFFGTVATGNQITLAASQGNPDSKTYTGIITGSSVFRIAGSRTVTVNMSARSNTEVSAGLYLFVVRFSAIPQ